MCAVLLFRDVSSGLFVCLFIRKFVILSCLYERKACAVCTIYSTTCILRMFCMHALYLPPICVEGGWAPLAACCGGLFRTTAPF